jgi:glutathione peroxidase
MKFSKLLMSLSTFIFSIIAVIGYASSDSSAKTVYGLSFDSLHGGKKIELSQFKNKVILIVNTASKCGFTPQYATLETLYKQYKDQGLVIIGVPSNDFGQQEPGANQEIETFCKVNFGVTFLMAAKSPVTGASAHPFFVLARQVLGFGSAPKWNFYKYIVGRNGQIVTYFSSVTKPDSPEFVKAIESALAKNK